MRKPRRQFIGLMMVMAAVLVAACIQWLGPGLVLTDYVPMSEGTLTKKITIVKRTRVNFMVKPLVLVALIGFVCAIIPARAGSEHHRERRLRKR